MLSTTAIIGILAQRSTPTGAQPEPEPTTYVIDPDAVPAQYSVDGLTVTNDGHDNDYSKFVSLEPLIPQSGKVYWEVHLGSGPFKDSYIGVTNDDFARTNYNSSGTNTTDRGIALRDNGLIWLKGSQRNIDPDTAGWASGDVIMLAMDFETGKFCAGLNGGWHDFTQPGLTGLVDSVSYPAEDAPFRPFINMRQIGGSATFVVNEADMAYAPPDGFEALVPGTSPAPAPVYRTYRHWRVVSEESGGSSSTRSFSLAELEFLDEAGDPIDLSAGTASASESHGSYPPENAFDGDPTTIWATGNILLPHHIAFDFGVPTQVHAIRMTARSGHYADDDMPTLLNIEGSEDGSNWERLRVISTTEWSPEEVRTFDAAYEDLGYNPDGAWSWFTVPRTAMVGTDLVATAVSSEGYIAAHNITQEFSYNLRGAKFQQDDHANPSILHREDGYVMAFASAHNGSGCYTYTSTNPDDVSEFGPEENIGGQLGLGYFSYPSPVQLIGEVDSPIYLFVRAQSPRRMWYSKSTDGVNWDEATELVSESSSSWPPYLLMNRTSPTRIDFTCTSGSPNDTAENSVYHFYYEGGDFHDTDGTVLTLPINPDTDLTPVYDATSAPRAWIWDIQADASGNPAILYNTFPSNTDHRYHRAIWDGSAWQHIELAAAGGYMYRFEEYYSGGMCFDPGNVDRIFASIEDGLFQIHELVVSGGTVTDTQLTSEAFSCYRPSMPPGAPGPVYFTGEYNSFTNYDTTLRLLDVTA